MTQRNLLLAAVFSGVLLSPLAALAQPQAERLIEAVQDGLEAPVADMLARHADVNVTDGTGATPLAWAIMRGNGAMAARLLKAHADPNLADANGVTPLMLAIDANDAASVKMLLAAGANASQARVNGETPLMHAVHMRSADMTRMLLAAGADVNARENQFGQNALMWAAGDAGLVRALLDAHADTHAVTKSWQTTSVNYITTTSTLGATGIPWNNEGEYSGKAGGFNALLFAVQKGDLESVKLLLDAGMDVNQAAADGTTPLLTALYNWSQAGMQKGKTVAMRYSPNIAIANLLLDHGAKVDAADRAGYTPLHGAVLVLVAGGTGRLPQIGFQPGKLSTPDAPPPTPPANEAEGLKLVSRMLELGADPNKATVNTTPGPVGSLRINPASAGSTPFHLAAFAHSARLIDLMAAHGANANIVRKDGHTPFSLSVMTNDLPVVQAMVAHGADIQMRYNPADKIASTDARKADAEPRLNETILHIAAIPGSNYVVGFLASKGAPLNAKNAAGQTPLELADEQERFRFLHDKEGPHGVGLEGENAGKEVIRETQTTTAFKQAMGIKTNLASN